MNIREMHYDFKKKYNKTDTQKHRNLLVPEIDWALNEGVDLFIKLIVQPRIKNNLGFEISHATTEDIKNLVVTKCQTLVNNVWALPSNYRYYVRGRVKMSKGNCHEKRGIIISQQHDDTFEESNFYKSSFEWGEVNALWNSDGILLHDDGTFKIDEACITYVRKHVYMHNAQDYGNGTYIHPSGVTLTGAVNCELSEHTHREIVDIAVMLVSGEIQSSNFQLRLGKLNFNQIV